MPTTNYISTREREAVSVMTTDEWLTVTQISRAAGIPNAYGALQRALAHGVVERRNVAKGVYEWRRTGRDFKFSASGIVWTMACEAFEAWGDYTPVAGFCGRCGHRVDGHEAREGTL
jgi:hypothetical protein